MRDNKNSKTFSLFNFNHQNEKQLLALLREFVIGRNYFI